MYSVATYRCLWKSKILIKERHLVDDRLCPIVPIMLTRHIQIRMFYIQISKFSMQLFIYLEKEILISTVYKNFQAVWFDKMQGFHHGVHIPLLLVVRVFSQTFGYFPFVRERAEIHASCCAAYSTIDILMTYSQI